MAISGELSSVLPAFNLRSDDSYRLESSPEGEIVPNKPEHSADQQIISQPASSHHISKVPNPKKENNQSSYHQTSDGSAIVSKHDENMERQRRKRGWRFYGTFVSLAILNFVCAVDATILSVALPTIATKLNGSAIEAFWCGTSFLLCSTVFQPSWASFSHIIGRQPVILASLVIFIVGTIVASVATNMPTLLVGRSIQGSGGGGIVALTLVVISDMVTLRERGKWISLNSAMWALGSVIGPVIGGAFAEKASWRWIFWFNIPFCVIGGIGIPICLKLQPKDGSILAKLQQFDWIGSILFIASTSSFLIPITWAGVMYAWDSWRVLVPLILGIIGLICFVIYSVYVPEDPLIRRSLFNSSTAIAGHLGTLVQGMIIWSLLYYLPLYFEVAKNYVPISAGIALFPLTFTMAPASVVVGLVIAETGQYRPSLWVGLLLLTFGMGLLTYLKQTTNIASWIFLCLVPGLGGGATFSALAFTVQSSVVNADLPFANALYSFFRAFGQALGVAISGVIFQNSFKKTIEDSAYSKNAASWSIDASALVEIIRSWSSEGDEGVMKAVVIQAYVKSLQTVWIVMCILAGVVTIINFICVKEISLDRELDTDQGFRIPLRD